jgi:hypothetical protein
MQTIIKYLPKETSQDEIKKIREEFKKTGKLLILMISGEEDIRENLCEFIKSR